MNKTLLAVTLGLAQMLAVSAFAQVKGEVDESCSRAIPAAKCTPAEIAAAKAARKVEGTAAAKANKAEDPAPIGVAKKATKAERKAAAAKRKTEAAAALKKGEIPSGEK